MRLPNSYGSITKLSGKRRRPFMVRITTGWDFDSDGMRAKQKQAVLGYYRTRSEALEALAEYNHDPYDLDVLTVTFNDIYEKIKQDFTANQHNALGHAYKYLAPVSNLPLRTIKATQLQDCIDNCQTTQKPLIKSIIKLVYTYALKNEITDKNPTQYLKAESSRSKIQREIFTHDEIEELWNRTNEWWAKMALMLLYSGCRTKELRTIDLSGLDTTNKWINLSEAKNECSVRKIPIHERTVPLFDDYISVGGKLYGYSHSAFNAYLGEFHGHRAHDCRKTFASRMRECGVDHLTIKRLLGHTPTDITERVYTAISDEELTAAVSKLIY